MLEDIFIIFLKVFFFKLKIIKYRIEETQVSLMADLDLTYKSYYYEFEIEYNSNHILKYFLKIIRIFLSIKKGFDKEKFDEESENLKSMKYSGYDVVSIKNDSFLEFRKDWFKFKLFLFEN